MNNYLDGLYPEQQVQTPLVWAIVSIIGKIVIAVTLLLAHL